ncbi:MAG: carboxy terminal-processing peptidase [Verrucomicrobiota bacterium]
MKRIFQVSDVFLRVFLAGSLLLTPVVAQAKKAPAARETQVKVSPWPEVARVTSELLETQHYLKRPIDKAFSRRVFDRYLENLDPSRLYFLQADVDAFKAAYRDSFASELKEGKPTGAFAIRARFTERVVQCSQMIQELLAEEWDFSKPWSVEYSREHSAWPQDDLDARRLWKEQMGAEMLVEILDGASLAVAKDRSQKHQQQALKAAVECDEKDRWAVALLAMARACDAHSDYLTQEELDDEESELRLTRVGIGVTLDGGPVGVRVAGVLPGGPAHRDGRLKVNDRIVAVAEEKGPFFEIEGLPLRKALSLLRGQKGTTVKLQVAPSKATDPSQRMEIILKRDEMRSSEGEVYGKMIERKSDAGPIRLGWISVPGFYGDDGDAVGRRKASVSKDVSILLGRFKSEHVAGVVLDLRGNLGGLLDEAIEMGGLFLGKVPIALARSQADGVEVLTPTKLRRAQYDGPLVVLTDHSSASASELVSGAIQDYGRGVVVGGEQTFGKGSVQMTVQLGEYLSGKNRQPIGGLALTIGKFYRVNGAATQLVGVRPDVVLPSTADVPGEGEAALIDPLPHDSITAIMSPNRPQIDATVLKNIRSESQKRVRESFEFQEVTRERDRIRKEVQENVVSLQESLRRNEIEAAQKRYSAREARMEADKPQARFYRVLLEDTKQKKLVSYERDPLESRDPESVAVEWEAIRVLEDLIKQLRR